MSQSTFTIFEGSYLDDTLNLINAQFNINFYHQYAGSDIKEILISSDNSLTVSISCFDNIITILDLTTLTVKKTITYLKNPLSGAISNDNNYLYIVCKNSNILYKIYLNEENTPHSSINLDIKPVKISLNSNYTKLFICGNSNIIDIVDCSEFIKIEPIICSLSANNYKFVKFLISDDSSWLIYASSYYGLITLINLNDYTSSYIKLDNYLFRIKIIDFIISQDNSYIFVIGWYKNSSTIFKMNIVNNEFNILQEKTYNLRLSNLVLSSEKNFLYLTSYQQKNIYLISIDTLNISNTIELINPVHYLLLDRDSNYGYAINKNNGLISTINFNISSTVSTTSGIKKINAINSCDISTDFSKVITINKLYKLVGPVRFDSSKINSIVNISLDKYLNNYVIVNGMIYDFNGSPLNTSDIILKTDEGLLIGFYKPYTDGSFSFSLPKNEEDYVITVVDHLSSTSNFSIIPQTAQGTLSVYLNMINDIYSESGLVIGYIFDTDGVPISNAVIEFYNITNGGTGIFSGHTESDALGAFNRPLLNLGSYIVVVNKNGYLPYTAFIIVYPQYSVKNIIIKLQPITTNPHKISGIISTANGIKLDGVHVELISFFNDLKAVSDVTITDINGNYSFDNLASNRDYYIEAQYWY